MMDSRSEPSPSPTVDAGPTPMIFPLAEWTMPDVDDQALANLSTTQIRQIVEELYACRARLTRQDEELRHSQGLMNYIIAHNPSDIAVYDREMRYIYVGQRYVEGYRAKGREVIGRCHYDVFPGVPQKWRDAHQRALAGEVLRAEEDAYIREDGVEEWIRWECRPWYEAGGAIGGIVLYTEDITKRKQAEAARRASEDRYRLLVQNLHAGIVVHAPDTQILLANEQAHQLLGLNADEALGKTVHDPDWYFLRRNGNRLPLEEYPVMQVLATQTPMENMVYGIKHPATQDVIWVMVNAFPEFDTDGSLRQVVVTFIDVSQQIQAEDLARDLNNQLNHQERLAAVGQLAAGIAHDFNNILAVIALQVPLLSRSVEMNERDRKRLIVIQEQIANATRLIQQILDFSRRAVLERNPLDLATFLWDQVNLLTHTLPANIQVSLHCEPDECVALVDLTRMQQMVMNLAVNARDAMPKGGRLHFTLARESTGRQPDLSAGPWIRLTVSDSGSGIPADILPHIFNPFFTTKSPGQGSGLGLSQVHGIVKQHGGEIKVQSVEGKGTIFTIYLPAMFVESNGSPSREADSWQGEGETILIVEDNAVLLDALQEIIEILGYRTVAARNGMDALSVLDCGEVVVDLILSDLVMPGMGGVDLLAAVRARNLSVPVVMLSGHPLEGELDDLTGKGVAGWLLKPVDIDLLGQTLAQALMSKQAA
ncbi:MAG: PAS domain-containing protein [Caldilineaceae bacterium]|nr:PAS domain-containing protein [Caldilineaceae bacterium]